MLLNIELSESNNTPQNTNSLLNKKRKAHKAPDSTNGNKKKRRKRGKEYYTLYKDIDEQMKAAQNAYDFKDKIVLCNCDNPLESNFFSYFVKNFHNLGLKKLICTCYKKNGKGLKIEIDRNNFANIFGKDFQNKKEEEQDDIIANFREQENSKLCYIKEMEDDGNCLGEESLKNLENSDIVVTNPPFGKIATQLIRKITDKGKKFILICELHDILGRGNNDLYNSDELKIDFGLNDRGPMDFNTPAENNNTLAEIKPKRIYGAKWINNINIKKYDYQKETRQYKDRVRKILDINNAYTIPDNGNLEDMLNDLKTTYNTDENSICLVPSHMFYSNNYLFNKKNFDIIGVADELIKGKKNRTIPSMDRRNDSPRRPFSKAKKLGERDDGKLFYFCDPYNVICNKKNSVDLEKIKQEDKTMNLTNINKNRFFITKE